MLDTDNLVRGGNHKEGGEEPKGIGEAMVPPLPPLGFPLALPFPSNHPPLLLCANEAGQFWNNLPKSNSVDFALLASRRGLG